MDDESITHYSGKRGGGPRVEVPREVQALCRSVTELGGDGPLEEVLELVEEMHGALGVYIDELRRERRHWIRGLHRQI